MRPHTRILYSLCDRITGEARGARQKDTGSNQARALHPTAQACAVGTPALPGYQGQSPAEPLTGFSAFSQDLYVCLARSALKSLSALRSLRTRPAVHNA